MRFRRTTIAIVALFLSAAARGDDWPQWRGPTRDGVWRETGIIEKFTGEQLPIKWRMPVAGGYSGPTVANGNVYVTDRVLRPTEQERVHCFDFATGKALWTHAYDESYANISYTAGPRAAVTIHDGRAYSLGAAGRLICFDAATGKVQFQRDLRSEYKIRMPIWGIAAAPLVEGELLILMIGGEDKACIVALDRKTGEEKWRALDDEASYSAPIVIEQGKQRVLVCWTGDSIAGLDPQTGEVFWQEPFKPTRMVINIATPVREKNWLFLTAFYDGSMMLKLDPERPEAQKVWRRLGASEKETDALHSIMSTPILEGDYVYGVDSYGELRCLDAKTGDRIWESKEATPPNRWSNIHMVRNGDKIWMFNEAGELIISKLSPKGYEEISRTKLISPTKLQLSRRQGVTWAHPAYANKHVLARNDEEIVCGSLEAK